MQRLFTMFPRGWPGFGLLLLRASVAIALLIEVWGRRIDMSGWITWGGILLSIVLFLGYLTPIVALMGLGVHVLIWLSFHDGNAILITIPLDAIALALLGPGAYSLDGYRFGRHVLILPPS